MRNKALELEIRMSRKPNISGKGKLYVYDDAQTDATGSKTKEHGMTDTAEEEKNV